MGYYDYQIEARKNLIGRIDGLLDGLDEAIRDSSKLSLSVRIDRVLEHAAEGHSGICDIKECPECYGGWLGIRQSSIKTDLFSPLFAPKPNNLDVEHNPVDGIPSPIRLSWVTWEPVRQEQQPNDTNGGS